VILPARRRTEVPLQRLFSTFPDGGPGIGLLLLRASVGGLAAVTGVLCLSGSIERVPAVWATGSGLAITGAALLLGFMTPYASLLLALCLLAGLFSSVPAAFLNFLGPKHLTAILALIAVAIALLGPGAYSVDGYLFGRREIVIPPHTPQS
jgi:putative oxidoreductase